MNYSVVVCTYNRSESLRRTLKSIREVTTPNNLSWEVIVVDNNSNDDTRLVFEEIEKNFATEIRYVFEDKQGISNARNRGVKESRGEIIAFADDDVIVDKYWIQCIDKAFKEHNDVVCIGGKILPIWEISKPDWLNQDLYTYLALLDYGDSAVYMDTPDIYSANIAVKSEMFKKHGVFDTNLGRIPKKLYCAEETDFLKRLLNAGEKILYHPSLIVHHHIPAHRISKQYMRKWNFDRGEMEGFLMEHTEYSDIMHFNSRTPQILLLRHVIASLLKIGFFAKNRFNHELRICHILGFLSGRMKSMNGK
jgi:glucosyl-dolichyl phosphate glucuronosyltransferase